VPLGFVEAIDAIEPHVLIGATGAPGTFTERAVERMCAHNSRPVLFALSNPTSKAECTAEQAYQWSRGHAIFASGSPFASVTYERQVFQPGQGNNAYVFPGIGLGALVSGARLIPDEFFLAAARTLAGLVEKADLQRGFALSALAAHSPHLARHRLERGEKAYSLKLTRARRPPKLEDVIARFMYEP
jgi:malate dehydrogenase (oxaloacetate-decarboxylating)(NADP+)